MVTEIIDHAKNFPNAPRITLNEVHVLHDTCIFLFQFGPELVLVAAGFDAGEGDCMVSVSMEYCVYKT